MTPKEVKEKGFVKGCVIQSKHNKMKVVMLSNPKQFDEYVVAKVIHISKASKGVIINAYVLHSNQKMQVSIVKI